MRVIIRVRDVESAVRFYRDALGLRVTERWARPGPGAIFDTGRGQIQVYASQNGAEEPPLPPPTILLVTPDADVEHARLASVGVQALWGPATTAWGTRQFAVQDPDGTTVVFCSAAMPAAPAADASRATS